jgi:hypothetical protein
MAAGRPDQDPVAAVLGGPPAAGEAAPDLNLRAAGTAAEDEAAHDTPASHLHDPDRHPRAPRLEPVADANRVTVEEGLLRLDRRGFETEAGGGRGKC